MGVPPFRPWACFLKFIFTSRDLAKQTFGIRLDTMGIFMGSQGEARSRQPERVWSSDFRRCIAIHLVYLLHLMTRRHQISKDIRSAKI